MTRSIWTKLISGVSTAGWSGLCLGAEWLPVLAQAQPGGGAASPSPAKIVPVRNYLWESIVVVLVSIAGLYAVCRTSRRQ